MPAPSALDLKRDHQGLGEEKSHSHHRFLARFLDKREMAKASCFETSASKGAAPNPKNPSPTRQGTAPNPKNPSPTRQGTAPNPKNPSPTRQDSNSTHHKSKAAVNPIPRSRVPGVRSMASPDVLVPAPGRREYPKSPLVSLLKKNQVKGNEVNRVLVTVNVLGSAGPLRFLVSCDDQVQKVIEMALKSYAREGRLPVLGQNIKQFELYCANSGCGEALDPLEIVGNLGLRNFLLCKKRKLQEEEEKQTSASHHHHQKSNVWKNWLLTMSSSFGVSSH